MTEPPFDDPNDVWIAEILADAEARGDAAILDGIARHPHLAARLIELRALQKSIHAARPGDALSPGEQLGDFRLLRKVGSGGMGEVYEAEQVSLGRRKVALKVMRHDRATEAMRERFRREQRILARLHQTHIVPIHVAGEEGGLHYLVMPFIDGAALHDLIAAMRRQPAGKSPSLTTLIEEAVQQRARPRASETKSEPSTRPQRLAQGYFRLIAAMMADVAEAIEAVHRAGFLHRDLKPGNLMVDRQGKVWIIDFGLACEFAEVAAQPVSADRMTDDGPRTISGVAGTPEYMAPEQREGKADQRSDVWALGATLYELTYLARVADQQRTDAVSPTNVPDDLAAICNKALQAEPAGRYVAAGDFARDLRRWLAHEPTVARGATFWRWAGLLIRRNPERAISVAGIMVALIAALGGVFLLQRQEATTARERAEVAERHEREQRRQSLLQQIDHLLLGLGRQAGWTRRGWALVEEAAGLGVDERLRELAAALDGLDAVRVQSFSGVSASSVAYDKEGTRLLLGGVDGRPAQLWAGQGKPLRQSRRIGAGPVAFASDGAALQLVLDAKDRGRLLLWDVERQCLVRDLTLPARPGEKETPVLAMSPDGAFVAAGATGRLSVWETRTGTRLKEFPGEVTAVAFAPDGSQMAAGNKEGRIEVRSLPSGEKVADLRNEGVAVTSLSRCKRDWAIN